MKRSSLLLVFLVLLISGCGTKNAQNSRPLVFVSILPQKFFVTQLVGDRMRVEVMVRPGQSPDSYDPTPRQLSLLSKSKIYFRIGVPFENAWMNRIQQNNPNLRIVDTRKGIVLRDMDSFESILGQSNSKDTEDGEKDPHIWLSPRLVKIQVSNIVRALIEEDPTGRKVYESNQTVLDKKLDILNKEIRQKMQSSGIKEILVFHPAWGYFLGEYGIKQIPIEIEGKSPSPSELSAIISYAKNQKIKVIFVQKQFSTQEAESIARAVGGQVVQIDPLSEDYLQNLRTVVEKLQLVEVKK